MWLWQDNLVLYPRYDSSPRDVVDLTLFEGFEPGLNFETAQQRFGSPSSIESSPRAESHLYHRPTASIVVAKEYDRDTFGGGAAWVLRLLPKDLELSQFLRPSVVTQLTWTGVTTLTLMKPDRREPFLHVALEGRRIRSVKWLKGDATSWSGAR